MRKNSLRNNLKSARKLSKRLNKPSNMITILMFKRKLPKQNA